MIPGNYSDYMLSRESSGGDRYAKNPRSSALGPAQFIDSTWEHYVRTRPDLQLTMDGRTDPAQSKRASDAFTADNAAVLQSHGHPINNDTLYLAHRFGAGGALKALSADPNTPVSALFPEHIMSANPDLANKRVADITGSKQMATPLMRPALSSSAQLGDGVLFPGSRDAPQSNWDNALIGAGSALAGISSPQQGAALAGLMRAGANGDNYATQYDAKTGTMFRVNKKTGRVEAVSSGKAEPTDYEKAYDQSEAKKMTDLSEKLQTDAQTSSAALANVQTLRQTLSNPAIYQGIGGDQALQLRKLGNTFGMNFEGVADADVAKALGNQLTLQLRTMSGGMPGSLSDKDLAFLKDANIGLDKNPDANQRLLDIFERAHNRVIEADKMRAEYAAQNGGRLDAGFRQKLTDKWSAENKALDAAEEKKPASSVVRWGRDKSGNPVRM